jgi:sec-independent protein translocase protein TatB
MSFGLTIEKLFLIGLVALLVVGPDRLPGYAAQLARLVKKLRDMARGAETRLKDEFGSDVDLQELKKLDPRQYDPRRIIREALQEDLNPAQKLNAAKPTRIARLVDGEAAPFDSEAT